MLSFFKNIFGNKHADQERYHQEKAIAQSGDLENRMSLAKNSKTHKEILYYLAEKDPSAKVRAAVARNKSTPIHAGPVLATDTDEDVRMALAARMVELLPELSHDKHSQLYAFVVQTLGTLALDEVLKVRKALASTLKDHAHTPPKVAGQLARDIEREVAEPILRFCAALADDDLLDILRSHPESWAIEAVAQRPAISSDVSHAVIDTNHSPAGALLIQNEGADISQSLLEHIVQRAREYPEWHEPIAGRKNLPPEMAMKLAEFVDDSVRRVLMERGDFDQQTIDEISSVVRRRIDFEEQEQQRSGETPLKRANRLLAEGRLNEETISDALAMRDNDFVIAAIALLCRSKVSQIKKVFEMKAPKPVCAICWKAGLSMRMALRLQQEIAHISSKELIYPKGGTDYPLSEDDLEWQLDFLGI